MRRLAIACLMAIVAGAGLAKAEEQGRIIEEVVAVVNGEAITKSEYLEAEQSLRQALAMRLSGEELEKKFEETKATLMDNLIEDRLLSQEASSKNYNVDDEIDEMMERLRKSNDLNTDEDLERALAAEGFTLESYKVLARQRLLKQRLISQEVHSKIDVTEEETKNYYSSHSPEFTVNASVKLREIFVGVEERGAEQAVALAETLRKRVTEGGEDFAAVATEASESPSKEQGGDLGWVEQPDLAEELEAVVSAMKPGDVSTLLTNDKGSRIIKLEESRPQGLQAYDDVRDAIQAKLREDKSSVEFESYLERLKKISYIFKPPTRK